MGMECINDFQHDSTVHLGVKTSPVPIVATKSRHPYPKPLLFSLHLFSPKNAVEHHARAVEVCPHSIEGQKVQPVPAVTQRTRRSWCRAVGGK